MADAGIPNALEAVSRMCRALGRGMHMIVSALAPSEIVVVGEIIRLWPLVFPIISAELRRFPLIGIPLLRMANEPDTARLRSAVALVRNEKVL